MLNGIVAVPLMAAMMIVIGQPRIMGKFVASRTLATFGWLATFLMCVVVGAFFLTQRRPDERRRRPYVSTIPVTTPDNNECAAPCGRAR